MKTFKKIFAPLAFFLALLCMVYLLAGTLLPKRTDGITPMKAFYDQPQNSVDVLVLGGSRAGMNISAPKMWEEYGIPACVLWGTVQPFWNSYYFLQEALKTQTPKVVVLDVYAANIFWYSVSAQRLKNTEGIKLSANKWAAIKASAPEDARLDLLTILPLVHDRYDELRKEDFQYYFWNDHSADKGYYSTGYAAMEVKDVGDAAAVTEVKPLHEPEEEYLNKIIDLCAEKDLPLLLIQTPTETRAEKQPYYNRVAQIAEERGLPFLNCNLLDSETGFDPATDFGMDGVHLNQRGAEKVARFLGQYLKDTYDLPDRRGTPGYESWDRAVEISKNELLLTLTDPEEYFSLLESQPYRFYLTKPYMEGGMSGIPDDLLEHLAALGFEDAVLKALSDPWQLGYAAGAPAKVDFYTGFSDIGKDPVTVDGQEICHLDSDLPGVTLLVWDTNTASCVDLVTFPAYNGYEMVRMALPKKPAEE